MAEYRFWHPLTQEVAYGSLLVSVAPASTAPWPAIARTQRPNTAGNGTKSVAGQPRDRCLGAVGERPQP